MEQGQIITVSLWVLSAFGSILAFFMIRSLKQIDENQRLLGESLKEGLNEAFTRISNIEKEHEKIKAFHFINHGHEL